MEQAYVLFLRKRREKNSRIALIYLKIAS